MLNPGHLIPDGRGLLDFIDGPSCPLYSRSVMHGIQHGPGYLSHAPTSFDVFLSDSLKDRPCPCPSSPQTPSPCPWSEGWERTAEDLRYDVDGVIRAFSMPKPLMDGANVHRLIRRALRRWGSNKGEICCDFTHAIICLFGIMGDLTWRRAHVV